MGGDSSVMLKEVVVVSSGELLRCLFVSESGAVAS